MAATVTLSTTAATLQTTNQPFGANVMADEFELVYLSGTDVLYFTTDTNVTPTVAGAGAYALRPGERLEGLNFADATGNTTGQTFKAISTTAVTYQLAIPHRTRRRRTK